MEEAKLSEVWRLNNPDVKHYSWFRYLPTPVFGRIDFYLISDSILSNVDSCEYLPGFKTDHSFIEIVISTKNDNRGPGMWKLNSTHIDHPEYQFKIKHVITKAAQLYADTTPKIKWEMIKCEIIGASKEYAYRFSEFQKNMIQEPNQGNLDQMIKYETEINNIIDQKTKGTIFRSKMR